MHYVKRGPKPRRLKKYHDENTGRWVEFYDRGIGTRPSDGHWRKFHDDIRDYFSGFCGYCETICKGEVDHFRPKSRFPQRVYDWSNWIFSCHDCNNSKGEKWPKGGYIDPCARVHGLRPERFFDFDLQTGEIIPKKKLTDRHWAKARRMIDDFELNAFHHLKNRLRYMALILKTLRGEDEDDPNHEIFMDDVSSRDSQFSSITRTLLAKQQS